MRPFGIAHSLCYEGSDVPHFLSWTLLVHGAIFSDSYGWRGAQTQAVSSLMLVVLITLYRCLPYGETRWPHASPPALSQVAAARTGPCFGPGWRRQPGRPRHSWIQQIGDGTPFSIRAEWSKARRCGHSLGWRNGPLLSTRFDDDDVFQCDVELDAP